MILKFLSIVNFKNYQNLQIEFSNNINCFLGNNGIGKTNLLDSIFYLSFCRSYFNSSDVDNIHYGDNFFMIRGDYEDENNNHNKIHCSLRNKKKAFKFNDKKYNKLSEHIGKVPLVIITPLDSNLIMGGSETRRKFFDMLISQIDSNYLQNLMSYNKLIKQRNSLLKQFDSIANSIDLLNTYDAALVDFGYKIYLKRNEVVNLIIKNVQDYYNTISDNLELIDIEYNSQLSRGQFNDLLIQNRKKDQILKHTSVGIHRDDFIFKLNTHSIKTSGSQGQQKSFIISLKFAYFDLLKSILNISPILLLDDIFDKLDNSRLENIIRILNKHIFGQIFITDTNFTLINSVMKKVDNSCKYFIFNNLGSYEEKFKK